MKPIMKNLVQKLLLLLGVVIVIFFSCKKDLIHSDGNDQKIASITAWLLKQENPNKPNRSKNIETLKAHLIFAAMHEENDLRGSTVVIPIDNTFRLLAKMSDESILNLVALLNKDGSIRNVHVAVYVPSKNKHVSELPKNTFHNIFHTGTDITDGQYRFLSPAGSKQYQLEYKSGLLAAAGHFTRNPSSGAIKTTSIHANTLTCSNVYLVTTYYVDGNEIGSDEQYIGFTCDGCDNDMYESLCGSDDEEGGGGGSNVYEYVKMYTKTWQVYNVNDTTSIYDTETFRIEDDSFVTGVSYGTPQVTHQPYGSTFAYSTGTGTLAFDYSWVTIYRNTSITYSADPAPIAYNGQQTWTVPQIKN